MPTCWWNTFGFVLGVGGGMVFANLEVSSLVSLDYLMIAEPMAALIGDTTRFIMP